ncbi:hypothetical protein [Nitrogeniibacter mangrovi]|nr:hypothetical protein [Nitrogeniibacter mangrovi]
MRFVKGMRRWPAEVRLIHGDADADARYALAARLRAETGSRIAVFNG